jgi:hypothetical protein
MEKLRSYDKTRRILSREFEPPFEYRIQRLEENMPLFQKAIPDQCEIRIWNRNF